MRLNSGVVLWQHQGGGVQHIERCAETFLLGDCGTGKTLLTLGAIAKAGFDHSLIVTIKPALRSVWEREIRNRTDGIEDTLILDKGTSEEKQATLREWRRTHKRTTVVVNYETARLLDLSDFEWDFAVTDESHRIKAHNSGVSNTLTEMLERVPVKLAMTGTGWDDRPTDVYGQVRWLGPRKAGNYWASKRLGTWTVFFESHVKYREVDHIKIPIKYINLDHLYEQIEPIFIYISRDSLPELPPVRHVDRPVTLSAKHMKAYRQLEKDLTTRLLGDLITADNQMVVKLRLHQIAGGYYQPDDRSTPREVRGGDAKLVALMGLMEEVGNEPTVIFTRFTEDVGRISTALDLLGVSTLRLVGGMDQHQEWQQGRAQVLIANIQAGSAGIDLTRAAVGVFYSTGYSNTDYTQACYRLDRPGQTRKVTFYHIIARDTVDEEIRDALSEKTDIRDEFLERFKTNASPARLPARVLRRIKVQR